MGIFRRWTILLADGAASAINGEQRHRSAGQPLPLPFFASHPRHPVFVPDPEDVRSRPYSPNVTTLRHWHEGDRQDRPCRAKRNHSASRPAGALYSAPRNGGRVHNLYLGTYSSRLRKRNSINAELPFCTLHWNAIHLGVHIPTQLPGQTCRGMRVYTAERVGSFSSWISKKQSHHSI